MRHRPIFVTLVILCQTQRLPNYVAQHQQTSGYDNKDFAPRGSGRDRGRGREGQSRGALNNAGNDPWKGVPLRQIPLQGKIAMCCKAFNAPGGCAQTANMCKNKHWCAHVMDQSSICRDDSHGSHEHTQ